MFRLKMYPAKNGDAFLVVVEGDLAGIARVNQSACEAAKADEELGAIAEALGTATRASGAIDDALAFVEASNKRIAAMAGKAMNN